MPVESTLKHDAQRVVIVTGAARGLGRDYAVSFARDGFRTVVADINTEGVTETVKLIEADGGEAIGIELDVTSQQSADAMVHETIDRWGSVDILVNNAGLFGDHNFGPLLDIDLDYWDKVMTVNLRGVLVCIRAVAGPMKQQRWGRVVNISSMGAHTTGGVYSISKLGVNQLTWIIAGEFAGDGVTVNCVAPGSMDVESSRRQHPEPDWEEKRSALNIVKRLGLSRDIYAAIRYFADEGADWCTGQTLMVNGGFNAHI